MAKKKIESCDQRIKNSSNEKKIMLTNHQLTNIFFGLIIYSSLSFLFIYNRSTMSILSVNFKVYGIVQGSFNRVVF